MPTRSIHGQRIRILDIDSPESRQPCTRPDGDQWRCGQQAALALADWIGARVVTCESDKLDRYKRHLARYAIDGSDIAEWLAANGWGVPYRDCKCEVVRDAAARAKACGLGIWSGPLVMPWEWRKAHCGLQGKASINANHISVDAFRWCRFGWLRSRFSTIRIACCGVTASGIVGHAFGLAML